MKKLSKVFALLLILALILSACSGTSSTSQSGSGDAAPSADSAAEGPQEDPGDREAQSYTLRIANVVQEANPMNMACVSFIEKIESGSNGRIKIENYPARQLGDDSELFAQVQQGSLDMALVSASPIGATNDLAAALHIPYLFTSWDQYEAILSNEVTDNLLAGLEVNNVKALGVWNAGNRYFAHPTKEVRVPNDIKGLKIRVSQTPLGMDIFNAMGASATPLNYGEIYTGLQNKVLDMIEMDISAILMEKHYEVVKYLVYSPHYTWPGIFVINKDLFDSFSPEDQALIAKAAKETITDNVNYIREIEAQCEKELIAEGVTIGEPLSAEELALWKERTADVAENWSNKDPRIKAFVDYALSLQ